MKDFAFEWAPDAKALREVERWRYVETFHDELQQLVGRLLEQFDEAIIAEWEKQGGPDAMEVTAALEERLEALVGVALGEKDG